MNFLIILVGLPASGKSTFALSLKRQINEIFPNIPSSIIDIDEIRNEIMPTTFIPSEEYKVREKFLENVKKNLDNGLIVIADDLNYYTSMRHTLKILTDDLHIKSFIIYVSTPIETCLKWNKRRSNPIPEDVIKKISKKFDIFGKYSWDKPFKILDLSMENNLDKIVRDYVEEIKKIVNSSRNDVQIRQIPSSDKPNFKKNLDLITRRIIGEVLAQKKYHVLKNEIINFRRSFVKLCQNKNLKETEISQKFKTELLKLYNIQIE